MRSIFIASLTAVAQQAYAVTSQISAQASAQASQTPSEALISIYENCQVQITDLVGYQSTLGNQLKLTPSFTLSGIDENCPAMSVKVWLEPPANCAQLENCPTEGLESTIEAADVKNGPYENSVVTSAISGEWFVHVTITPDGFDCAMSITDGCAGVNVEQPCAAVVSDFDASNSINTALGAANEYNGANGIIHHMNWSVSDLWNCNLCAQYGVASLNGKATNSGTMTWEQLYQFSQVPDNSRTLNTDTSYQPFDYTLTVADCDSGVTYWTKTIEIGNPHPECDVQGTLNINSASASGTKLTDISQSVMLNPSYSCADNEFTQVINNDDWYTAELKSVFDGPGEEYAVQSTPPNYSDVVWENLPLSVNSTVTVQTRLAGVEGAEFQDKKILQATKPYQPECDFRVSTPSFNAHLQSETSAWGTHKLDLVANVAGEYGYYCPGFTSEVTYYWNDAKMMSVALTPDQTSSFFAYGTDYTGNAISRTDAIDFAEGTYCIEFSMTPNGESAETQTSQRVCQSVTAPACEITPSASINGVLNNENYQMTYTNGASYTMNQWCQPDALSFAWTYKYMNMDWQDETVEGIPYQEPLANDQSVTYTWAEAESDFEVVTKLDIAYAPTVFMSQLSGKLAWMADDSFSWQKTCRPKFAYDPTIYGIDLAADGTLTFSVLFETATTGMNNCGELYATVQIFNEETDEVVFTENLTNDQIVTFQNTQQPPLAITGMPEVGACYMVKITYGQVGRQASAIAASTDTTCYWPTCILANPSIVHVSNTTDSDGQTVQWTLSTDVTSNKWCEYINQQVCVKDETSGAMWCNQPDSSSNAATVVVTQHGDFGQTHFTGIVDITSSNGTHVQAETPLELYIQPSWCNFNYETGLTFWTDSLTKVGINHTASGTANKVCGTPYIAFKYNNEDYETDFGEVASHYWSLPSRTGSYSFTTYFKFSHFMDYTFSDNGISGTWTQGCGVQIDQAQFTQFICADNVTNTDASAHIFVNGTKIGDCGNDFTITATLTGNDGSSYNFSVDSEAFFSNAGQSLSQQIDRESAQYSFTLGVVANDAETVADHQAQTASEGYVQVLSDSASTTATSCVPICNVFINDLQFLGYREESDWQGPMLATYSGQISAEQSCDNLSAQLRLRGEDETSYITAVVPELTKIDEYNFNFTTTVSGPNLYGNYYAKLQAYDQDNEVDKVWDQTEEALWDPPCYLDILKFERTNQVSSVDNIHTQLSYNIEVAEYGDNACRDTHLEVQMAGTDGNSFKHWFNDNDKAKALQPYGFNYTVQIQANGAPDATIDWKDPRAVENQTAETTGFTPPNDVSCQVNVIDFCLIGATPVENATNRWAFDFTIRAQANSQCGSINAWLDVIYEQSTYLGGVTVPGSTIIDSFTCDCPKTFTVEVDYDGAAGSMFGQLDIRNNEQELIQIVNSCVQELPM